MKTKDKPPGTAHLWECDHPYYCNEGNYFKNGCFEKYQTWAGFVEAEGDSDPDMNLLFRWDWHEEKFSGDVNYPNGTLLLFWMGQRKGLYRWSEVAVCRADEREIRKWLEGRWEHFRKLWTPFTDQPCVLNDEDE